jgi:hypothetical protein
MAETAFLPVFHKALVRSNLDLKIRRADYRHGGSGVRKKHETGPKSLALKILTCNSLWLKILPANFANPAPFKAFEEPARGGVPLNPRELPKRSFPKHLLSPIHKLFFRQISTAASKYLLAKLPRHPDFA